MQRKALRILPYWRHWCSRPEEPHGVQHAKIARLRRASHARQTAELQSDMRVSFALLHHNSYMVRSLRRAVLRLRGAVRWRNQAARAAHVLQRMRVRRMAYTWSREARHMRAAASRTILAAAAADAAALQHAHLTWQCHALRALLRRSADPGASRPERLL